MNGSSSANGTTTASAVRSVSRERAGHAGAGRRSAARAESRGRIAVASETVTIECGTIMIRNVEE